MMRKVFLFGFALGVATAFGNDSPEVIKDGSILGFWRFNGTTESELKFDSSIYGSSGITSVQDANYVQIKETGGFGSAGGYLNISKDNYTATASLSSTVPALNGTTYPYYTLVTRFRPNKAMASGRSGVLPDVLNDTQGWHFMAMRYQSKKNSGKPNTNASYNYAIIFDPRYNGFNWEEDKYKDLEIGTDSAQIPLTVNNDKTVTIGGQVSYKSGWSTSKLDFQAALDDVMVVNRLLTKPELMRLYHTGETYIYMTGGNNTNANGSISFASEKAWSSSESTVLPKPGDIPGAAYLVDNAKTLCCTKDNATCPDMSVGYEAKFGGDNYRTVSLTIGRLFPLTDILDPSAPPLVSNTNGTFSIFGGPRTKVVINDLRLNAGLMRFTSSDMTFEGNLTVGAPRADPFVIRNNTGENCKFVGTITGSGYLKKQGAGNFDMTGLEGDFRLILASDVGVGKVKTRQLFSYEAGVVVVDAEAPVVFKDDGTVNPANATKGLVIVFESVPPRGRHHVLTLPAAYADSAKALTITDQTDYSGSAFGHAVVREGREVYVELPAGDFGPVPLLIGE